MLRPPESSHNPSPPKLLISQRDAAKALSISERTLWAATKRGEIPYINVGARVLYSPAALAEWIAARQSRANAH
jgi:excisionase family DNA binding protein